MKAAKGIWESSRQPIQKYSHAVTCVSVTNSWPIATQMPAATCDRGEEGGAEGQAVRMDRTGL